MRGHVLDPNRILTVRQGDIAVAVNVTVSPATKVVLSEVRPDVHPARVTETVLDTSSGAGTGHAPHVFDAVTYAANVCGSPE